MKRDTFLTDTEHIPLPDKERVDAAILLGQRYMNTHTPRRTPAFYLFVEQIKYLSPSLWLFQLIAAVLISAFAVSQADGAENVYSVLFQIAPLVSVMAVPELIKDVLCNMSELERSCKNSGSVLLLLRLIAVGMLNVLVIAFMSGILAGVYRLNFFVLLLYAFVPYNCANIISLLLIRVLKINSRFGTLTVSFTSALALMILPLQTQIVYVLNTTTLLIALLGTMIILAVQVIQVFKEHPKGELLYGTQN